MLSKNNRRFGNRVLGTLRVEGSKGVSDADLSKVWTSESDHPNKPFKWENLTRDEMLEAIRKNKSNYKRDFLNTWTTDDNIPDLPPESLALAKEYFKSTTDFVIYTLLETDGRRRCDNLGVRKIHYMDKQAANEWKLSVQQYLHANDIAALVKLENLYANMVDDHV